MNDNIFALKRNDGRWLTSRKPTGRKLTSKLNEAAFWYRKSDVNCTLKFLKDYEDYEIKEYLLIERKSND